MTSSTAVTVPGPLRPANVTAPALDLACVWLAWLVGYLLRLGVERLHVVTLVPEVLFILMCGVVTVATVAFRRHYRPYATWFARAEVRRLAATVLVAGYGLSAAARFADLEIISRTAIVLAPPLTLALMLGWRLVADQWQRPRVQARADGAMLLIVNLHGQDLSALQPQLQDIEYRARHMVFGSGADAGGGAGVGALRPLDQAYEAAARATNAVIALPESELDSWPRDPRYKALPGHRFVSIETLISKAGELQQMGPIP